MKNKTLLSASLVLMMAMPAATASAQGTLEDQIGVWTLVAETAQGIVMPKYTIPF